MADSKHTVGELRQLQSLPLRLKIPLTQQRIRDWYEHWDGQVYVSFSGGKDSTVLKHIVDSMYSDVPAVFVNTGLEYPEIQRFVREVKAGKYDCFNSDVEILRPEMRFDEVIREYGYPVISKEISERVYYAKRGADWAAECLAGRNPDGTPSAYKSPKWQYLVDAPFCVSHKCCSVMKKKPSKHYERQTGRKPILGTMACESRLRQTQWAKVGCNAFDAGRPRSAPLSFWTEQDVLLLHHGVQCAVCICIRRDRGGRCTYYYRMRPNGLYVLYVWGTSGEGAKPLPAHEGHAPQAICLLHGQAGPAGGAGVYRCAV